MARQQRPNNRARQPLRPGQKRGATAIVAVCGAIALLLVAIVIAGSGLLGGSDDTAAPAGGISVAPATAAGIEAAEPWADLGRVPLDTPVRHAYTLRNTGDVAASLGKATIEVLEGC